MRWRFDYSSAAALASSKNYPNRIGMCDHKMESNRKMTSDHNKLERSRVGQCGYSQEPITAHEYKTVRYEITFHHHLTVCETCIMDIGRTAVESLFEL